MKNLTRHTGVLELLYEMEPTKKGRERLLLRCDGYTFRTLRPHHVYSLPAHYGKRVTVELGAHRGELTLNAFWPLED